jgi:two-component system LytT family sensor kinase
MKKPVIVLLHIGYWLIYSLLLFVFYGLISAGMASNAKEISGIGVHFANTETGLKVDSITKDKPAFKQGELKIGDEILKIAQETGPALDITDMPPKELHRLVRGEKGTKVHLTVKKTDGTIREITLVRDVIAKDDGPSGIFWFLVLFEFAFLPGFITFYLFYTTLFTRFLSKRKIGAFILWGLATAAVATMLGETFMFFSFPQFNWILGTFAGMGLFMIYNALLNGILGLVMRGFINWYGNIRIMEDLNKKNYEMELALVKSQINPHFLFNTINNIDVLILKDPPKASAYLNKLSDMMRFMLYETKTEKVPLRKELDYIEKYIELQKIRTSNLNYINYEVKGNTNGLMIEPMLFIPFIENAFKHAENKNVENAIVINFAIEEYKITFECNNKYVKQGQEKPDHSGIGNELIRKRLKLLYPENHLLEIKDKDQEYSVKVELNLK